METFSYEIGVKTTALLDILDITKEVGQSLEKCGVTDGLASVFVPGSTGALTTIEFESGVLNDLRAAIERLAPEKMTYDHDQTWGDGNGYSHVRAALLGPSLTIPISAGRLTLGTWQQIVLLDFDNRPRTRQVLIQIIGKGN